MHTNPYEPLLTAYLQGHAGWQGCYWATSFGASRLDLRGIGSVQALATSRATSGDESATWYAAAMWLKRVEEAASLAETEATRAISAFRTGDIMAARKHAERACALELHYHDDAVWRPLLDATHEIESSEREASSSCLCNGQTT